MRNWLIAALGVVAGLWIVRVLTTPSPAPAPVAEQTDAEGSAARDTETPDRGHEIGRVEESGIAVSLRVTNLHPDRLGDGPLRAGDPVAFRFDIGDTATGRPVSGAYPAAWMVAREGATAPDRQATLRMAESFVGGSIFQRPVLDLNVYFVLTLNGDATLSVVDPLFGFGGSKLLALVELPGVGEDWALSPDNRRLFVSIPEKDRIAVVETSTWKVVASVATAPYPTRIAMQSDGGYLWVACGAPPAAGELTVVRCADLEVVGSAPLGGGPHDLALSDDLRRAYVSNRSSGSVTVVDASDLNRAVQVETGPEPCSVAWSEAAGCAYVAHAGAGLVVALGAAEAGPRARISLEGGLGALRFAPGGRYGFIVQPEHDLLHVFDAATNTVIQKAATEAGPDQVTFTDDMAYVRHRASPTVVLVPLDQVGSGREELAAAEFPGGEHPTGQMSRPTPAPTMVPAPGSNAMLVANPRDQSVYFYKEGMAAPLGRFSNYGREPRAVLAVDRSLRERAAPGAYETERRLGEPGVHDVVFFLDAPRIIHAFEVRIEPDPASVAAAAPAARVEAPGAPAQVPVGRPVRLALEIVRGDTDERCADLADVTALVCLNPGTWSRRARVTDDGDGRYGFEFTPPEAGLYEVFLECPSMELGVDGPWRLRIEAEHPPLAEDDEE